MPLSREDRWLTGWLLLCLALTALMLLVNETSFRYTGIWYYPRLGAPLICLAVQFAYFDRVYLFIPERAGFILKSCALYALANIAMGFFVTGAQFTPFPTIDAALQRWDHALHFDTAAMLVWTAGHPRIRSLLALCYASTDAQLTLAPLVAGFAFDRKRMRTYLYAYVYSFVLGGLFYYFFPSSGPGSIYRSPHFTSLQYLTSAKFYRVHHFQPVTTIMGGMIAFPSFHVMWSVLATYAARPNRKLFCAVAALNVLVVASTVVLGWHYLVDVPAGLALGALSLYAGERTYRRFAASEG